MVSAHAASVLQQPRENAGARFLKFFNSQLQPYGLMLNGRSRREFSELAHAMHADAKASILWRVEKGLARMGVPFKFSEEQRQVLQRALDETLLSVSHNPFQKKNAFGSSSFNFFEPIILQRIDLSMAAESPEDLRRLAWEVAAHETLHKLSFRGYYPYGFPYKQVGNPIFFALSESVFQEGCTSLLTRLASRGAFQGVRPENPSPRSSFMAYLLLKERIITPSSLFGAYFGGLLGNEAFSAHLPLAKELAGHARSSGGTLAEKNMPDSFVLGKYFSRPRKADALSELLNIPLARIAAHCLGSGADELGIWSSDILSSSKAK
ncbi:MAG: hypothetical protein WC759_03335 [Candidatus Micrarchaeia archaeon]|jgi:hypothetical protein